MSNEDVATHTTVSVILFVKCTNVNWSTLDREGVTHEYVRGLNVGI